MLYLLKIDICPIGVEMSVDEYKKKVTNSDEESGSGSDGQSGQIAFRDFMGSNDHLRDDLLPLDERKRLLSIHQEIHETKVKNQKALREERKQLKEGQKAHAYHGATAAAANYPAHPILHDKAQFSGSLDEKINPAAEIFDSPETNPELQIQPRMAFERKYHPELGPRVAATPTPSPFKQ